ncbi:receptor-type guanylate cyclase gcy-13-like [Babylonia areolata]|uniref:receptor-type guanylate cyclase gcy-13-like n=1 Tax=Babylonia areolata TaxID=304850 RepID=UPI003FD52D03
MAFNFNKKYPRATPDQTHRNLLIAVCGRFKWKRVAMVSSSGPMTTAVSDFFKELLREESDFYLVRHFSNVSRISSDAAIVRRLALISEEARIVFLVIPETEVRRYLLHAFDMGMTTGEYQFLYVQPYISDDDEVDRIRSQQFWKRDDGRDDDAKTAYRSLIVLTYSFILRWNINSKETAAITDDVFSGYRNEMPPYAEPDRYSRFLHDAFYLYSLAYNRSHTSNLTSSGEDIFRMVSNIRFTGLTGDVHMNNNADRLPSFLLWDMGPDMSFRIVIRVKYDVLPNGTVFINFTTSNNIFWGNGQSWFDGYVPADVPACGFNNEKCPPGNISRHLRDLFWELPRRQARPRRNVMTSRPQHPSRHSHLRFAEHYNPWWNRYETLYNY